MNIGVISDLHIKNNFDLFKTYLIKNYFILKLDMLLIAGDITNDIFATSKFVESLNEVICVYYIPGNHDLFNKVNKLSSDDILKFCEEDIYCINNSVLKLNSEWSIVAHIGWYDYSYGNNEKFSIDDFNRMSFKASIWQDKNYIDLTDDNLKTHELFMDEIELLLNNVTTDKVILMSHMLNNKKFSVSSSHKSYFDYFNAFLGSSKLYEFSKRNNVMYAICGHVHFRYNFIEDNTNYICSCLGYEKEYKKRGNTNLEMQLLDSIYVIKI